MAQEIVIFGICVWVLHAADCSIFGTIQYIVDIVNRAEILYPSVYGFRTFLERARIGAMAHGTMRCTFVSTCYTVSRYVNEMTYMPHYFKKK